MCGKVMAALFAAVILMGFCASSRGDEAASGVPPAYRIRDVSVSGVWPLRKKSARQLVEPLQGKAFEPSEVQAVADRLRIKLEENFYPDARVRWKALSSPEPGWIDIVFDTEPGQRGRILEMVFLGARAVDGSTLRRAVKLRDYGGVFDFSRSSILRRGELGEDQKRLVALYQERGHWDAVVREPCVDYLPGKRGYRIVWQIEEGPVYAAGHASISGVPLRDRREILERAKWRSGEVLSRSLIERLHATAQLYCYDQGYPFAEVRRSITFDSRTRTGNVDLEIDMASPARLRGFEISGTRRVYRSAVRRAFPINEGDRFSRRGIVRGTRNLEESGIFESMLVEWRKTESPSLFDVFVQVEEKPSGSASVGIQYNTDMGASLFAELRERNFAFGPPWRGQRIYANVGGAVGSGWFRAESTLTYPQVLMNTWDAEGGVFYEKNDKYTDSFGIDTLNASSAMAYPLVDRGRLSAGPEILMYESYATSTNAAELLQNIPMDATLLPIRMEANLYSDLLLDRYASPFYYDSLTTLKIASDAVASDLSWIYFDTRLTLVIPLPKGIDLESRLGWATSDGGVETEKLPLPIRLYLGGTDTLRAFAYRSVGAIYENDVNLGAGSMMWSAMEGRWRLREWLALALFYEWGDVSINSWELGGEGPVSGWGFGFLLGPKTTPIRVDVGFPVETLPDDSVNERGKARFSVSGLIYF